MAKATHDKIIEVAQELFNRNGFGGVTTSEIAKTVGIAEGNLWYHFKNKRALLEAINLEFIRCSEERMAINPGDGFVLDEFVDSQIELSKEVRKFRFMYRDQADYGQHTPELERELPRIYDRTIEQYRSFILKMRDDGIISISPPDVEMLCHVLVLIFRYGLEFLRESHIKLPGDAGPITMSVRFQALVLSRFMPRQYVEEFEALLLKKLSSPELSK